MDMGNKKVLLTVFTPAFNRAHTLPRTYNSLLNQTCKNFTWLIIDDGSSDDTGKLVNKWIERNNGFQIKYIYKENGGMHTAHNVAYENINTELNVCIDSDDCMPKDAVELILKKWDSVKDKGYAGIIGLDADLEGKIIGKGFPENMKETTVSGYYAKGGAGDKKLVYRTDLMKMYPEYPVFPKEKYVSLSYKYRLIDQKYKMAVLNSVLCNVEYQHDGSSATMFKQYLNNPKGFIFWRKVCMTYPISMKRLFVDCVHYNAECILAKERNFLMQSPKRGFTIIALPFGLLLSIYIKNKSNV